MSSSVNTAKVVVNNNAQFPLAELAIIHWQTDGDYQQKTVWTYYAFAGPTEAPYDVTYSNEILYDGDKRMPLIINFTDTFEYDSGHDDYWTISWRNMHDPCLYYLVKDLSFWQEFTRDTIKLIDTAVGGAVDLATDSLAGTVGALAANQVVEGIYESKAGSAQIENKLDTEINVFTINLPCNRSKYLLESGDHSTGCSTQTYMPGTNNTCYASN